jgi:anhydro-N-acetylmuramic acid kinase
MSGTSADGVDVAIVSITGRGLEMSARLIHHHHLPYDAPLRQRIFSIRSSGSVALSDLADLGSQISQAYSRAVNEALSASRLSGSDLAAVAAHGQTLYHHPPETIQWLDPALIASQVGCPVISDFRRADCAAGGQGAPLVPFADYILFRHPEKNRVLLNIGGIANITWLKAGGTIDDVIAFDTGPGNCLSDWICTERDPGGIGYDAGGARALAGRPKLKLSNRFLNASYFQQRPPKSTDTPTMIRLFKEAMANVPGSEDLELNDLLATAALATSLEITAKIGLFFQDPEELIVSGGGAKNEAIMAGIEDDEPIVGVCDVLTTDEFGVPSAAKEALAFALLGAATLDGQPSNIPSVTGAKRPVVLGSITPKP